MGNIRSRLRGGLFSAHLTETVFASRNAELSWFGRYTGLSLDARSRPLTTSTCANVAVIPPTTVDARKLPKPMPFAAEVFGARFPSCHHALVMLLYAILRDVASAYWPGWDKVLPRPTRALRTLGVLTVHKASVDRIVRFLRWPKGFAKEIDGEVERIRKMLWKGGQRLRCSASRERRGTIQSGHFPQKIAEDSRRSRPLPTTPIGTPKRSGSKLTLLGNSRTAMIARPKVS